MKSCTILLYGLALQLPSIIDTGFVSAFVVPPPGIVALQQQHRKNHVVRSAAHVRQDRSARNSSVMAMSGREDKSSSRKSALGIVEGLKTALTSTAIGLALAGPLVSLPGTADAADKRVVGEISASGLVFKDKLNVEAFSDPMVEGVTLYLSDFTRPVADKLINGDIFSEPSSASMTCVRSGPMVVRDGINTSKEGEELLKEDRSMFKSIVVRRLYDKKADNVVYVSFSSKIDTGSDSNKSRFKSSLCALHVE